MEISELKNSKYFCMAPFVHIRNVGGIPSPCCMIKENLIDCHTPRNLNSAFISPEWENFRQEMLKNEFNPNCTNCYIEEDNNLMSLRKNLNEHHLSFSNIKNPKIRDIDMAMSNKCNFKCVTCGIDNSSAWYDEEKLLKSLISRPEFPFEHDEPILDSSKPLEDVNIDDIRVIRMLGGEPFLDKKFLSFLKKLKLEEVKIFFVTNCSIFPKQWLETLSKAKELVVMFSIDGVNEVGEFVRFGYKQSVFDRNLKKWLNFLDTKKTTIYYHFVCHIMNVLNYDATIKYLKQFDGKIWLSMLHTPEYLNLKYLPDNIKDIIESKVKSDSILKHLKSGFYDKKHCDDFLKYIFFLENRSTIPDDISFIRDKLIYG